MLIYKNTFENIKTINCCFPIEDQYYASDDEGIVVDGITRDPTQVFDLSSCTFKEMLEKYPRPSGGEMAAKRVVETFKNSTVTLKERLIECNNAVKTLNDKYIKICDYLQNDYYGAVASYIKIENNILNYSFICDSGVIVYDSLGNIKFQTEDEKELYSDPYIDEEIKQQGIPWSNPDMRVIIRKNYRNNLDNVRNGRIVSYGALTGEESATQFIRFGKLNLNSGDIVVLYSDGFAKFLHDEDFIKHIMEFEKGKFEEYINMKSESDYNKYGAEKTIILYKQL